MHIGLCEPLSTALYLVSRSATPVVSTDDMKAHLRVDFDDDNDLIASLVDAVTQNLDGDAGSLHRSLVDQTWDVALNRFDWLPIFLPLPSLVEVESVSYYDTQNVLQVLDETTYEVVGAGGSRRAMLRLARGKSWPQVYQRAEPVTIRMRAGYLDMSVSPPAEAVPSPIKAAIKLMVGTLYANRETVVIGQSAIEIPWAAEALLRPYRVYA